MAIEIELNGEPSKLASELTLSEAIVQWGYEGQMFAIAVNACFVPRSEYAQVKLQSGDSVELVTPIQGG